VTSLPVSTAARASKSLGNAIALAGNA